MHPRVQRKHSVAKKERNASARKPSTRKRSPRKVVRYRYDLKLEDMVETTEQMSVVRFQRLSHSVWPAKKTGEVFEVMKSRCEAAVKDDDEQNVRGTRISQLVLERWPDLSARFYNASVEVWHDRAMASFWEIRDIVVSLLYDLARAGQLSLILPERIVLFSEEQHGQLPAGWETSKPVDICTSE